MTKLKRDFIFLILFFTSLSLFSVSFYISIHQKKKTATEGDEYIELPILMYHGLTQNKKEENKYVIAADAFASDLQYIKENNYQPIFVQDLLDYFYEQKGLPLNPIMITFDDGYYNNYLYAFPKIKEYKFKVIISPIGKQIDLFTEKPSDNPRYAHCNWTHIKEMKDSGYIEFQNHSYDMHKCNGGRIGVRKKSSESKEQYKSLFSNDFNLVQQKMKEHLDGYTPTTFVYPFGAGNNEFSREILKEAGFKALMTCEEKVNKIGKDPEKLYKLCRILRPPKMSSESFFRKKVNKARRL
jgi:peptidoglycan/xylan/chitin deacetylase (PgdA/CDA1 family)